MQDSAAVIASTMPSARKSWPGSADMLSNGSTTMEGLSGSASSRGRAGAEPDEPDGALPTASFMCHARIGSLMFFKVCSPMSSNAISTLPRTCRWASSEMQTPPGSAIPSSRAAMLTPSPKISSSSKMISPTWMPMRNSILKVSRHVDIPRRHRALYFDRAAGRIDGAGELDQHAVAGRLDDAAVMRGNTGIDQGLPEYLQLGQRALLVTAHQPAIAGDVSRQHRRQSPVHALAGQELLLNGDLLKHVPSLFSHAQ